jgi:hypothetical protein
MIANLTLDLAINTHAPPPLPSSSNPSFYTSSAAERVKMSSDWLPCDCLVKLEDGVEINQVHGYEASLSIQVAAV